MKSVKDKEFDDLFKNKLKEAEFDSGYLEDDWDNLELMLDKPSKRRGIVFWLPLLSSAAAVLIFLGWWMFRADVAPLVKPKQDVAAVITKQSTKLTDEQPQTAAVKTQPAQSQKVEQVITKVQPSNTLASVSHHTARNINGSIAVVKNQSNIVNQKYPVQTIDNGIKPSNHVQLANNRQDINFLTAEPMLGVSADNKAFVAANVDEKPLIKDVPFHYEEDAKKPVTVQVKHRTQFALTVLGAPEINGVGSFGDAKAGTNLGLLFSAGISNKITISTGANYAIMPYNTSIANYHTNYTFKTNPSQIEADCRALDIPLNIDYQLYNKHQNKFSIGTGLSSYIMLHESYDYYYADPATKGPTGYVVPNSGKYFFGVANIQATYTRQVNSKFGISVQPYLKLPLTNIGYSQAKLQTAGVAVGLSWNINSLTKP